MKLQQTEKWIVKILMLICGGLTSYLFLQSVFTLCCIRRVTEQVYYIQNNWLIAVVGIVLVIIAAKIALQPGISMFLRKWAPWIFRFLLICMSGFLIWWTSQTMFWYYGDTEKIYMCAEALLGGNSSPWQPGGYAYMWPFQNGLILLVALMLKVTDVNGTYILFYGINIAAQACTVIVIYRIYTLLFPGKATNAIQGILLTIYLPYAFLTMNIYGDHLGYALSLAALYFLLKYRKDGKVLYLTGSAVLLGFGVVIKQNCLILFIACLILLALNVGIKDKNVLEAGKLVLYALVVAVIMRLPSLYISTVLDVEISQGNSKWAHVAMGLQDSDKAPGWYNGYNEKIYEKNGYDTDATAKVALEAIGSRLEEFAADPMMAWEFFNKKIASEWNNPTFECFHVQNARNTSVELSPLVKSCINDGGKLNMLLIWLLDIGQSVLWFGMLQFFFHGKCGRIDKMICGILFIGAFVFWFFWEAKARYVSPYFFLMIPYAVMGYRICAERLRLQVRKTWAAAIAAIGVLIVLNVSDNDVIKSSIRINEDTEAYYSYIHEYNDNFMSLRY